MNLYSHFFKRGIDIAVSGAALLVLAVPLAAVTVWLHFANKGAGAFFLQERPGKGSMVQIENPIFNLRNSKPWMLIDMIQRTS